MYEVGTVAAVPVVFDVNPDLLATPLSRRDLIVRYETQRLALCTNVETPNTYQPPYTFLRGILPHTAEYESLVISFISESALQIDRLGRLSLYLQ